MAVKRNIIESIKTLHDLIYKNFDLGTPGTLCITIVNQTCILTNTFQNCYGKKLSTKDLGKEIAETILLNGLHTKGLNYGNFFENQSLISVTEVLNQEEGETIICDYDFIKIWNLARLVCNTAEKNLIYTIYYDMDAGIIFKTFTDTESFEKFWCCGKYEVKESE